MNNHSWKYYKSFENDIRNLSRYIELNQSNYSVYSIELVRLYLSICSEVDVTLKEICALLDPNEKPRNIKHYYNILGEDCSMFNEAKVVVMENHLSFQPWSIWTEDKSPDWWVKHNAVKHQRHLNYHDASLGNVLAALCGLFVAKVNYITFEAIAQNQGQFGFDRIKKVLSSDDLVQFEHSFLYMSD